jgi:hypothetical protein
MLYGIAVIVVKYEVVRDTFGNHIREYSECLFCFVVVCKNLLEFAVA